MAPRSSTETAEFVLQTHSVSRLFGRVRALHELDLAVPKGAIYGFLGANGAGKTTTIRILMGILRASSGEVEMFGTRSTGVSLNQRRWLSYVSQEQFFYPWMKGKTLGKFVSGFYPSWDEKRFYTLLDLFQVPANRRVDELSGGMRTKLALAVSIACSPQVLILDEPTTGLDPVARREFMNLVVECARDDGKTVFFSSHLVNEVERFADHIGMIHHGQLRFQGTLDEVYSRIRKVTSSSADAFATIPADFEVWQKRESDGETSCILHAPDAALWKNFEENPDIRTERLSLEDAFLASTGTI